MPGAILPAFLLRWHLSDQRAGVLLLCCAVGSSLGALFSLSSFRATITLASAFVAAAALLWASPLSHPEAPGFLWGLGLGMLMTSISLLQQRSSAGEGATALLRLNFLWALGAFFCAPLMTHALRAGRSRTVLLCFALGFALYGVGSFLLLTAPSQIVSVPLRARVRSLNLRGLPVGLILACALTVAVEAACGGWLSTYATRQRDSLFAIVAAPTCLWAGLLLSRALSWLPTSRHLLRQSLTFQVGLVVVAALVILLSHAAPLLLLAAFGMGFGLGPLYALMLNTVLRRRQTGAIFLIAGIAGSLLPWFTGLVSTYGGSLSKGFVVVVLAAIVLAVLILYYHQEILAPGDPAPTSS